MTDQATETAEAPKELKFPDGMAKAAYEQIVSLTSERNGKVGKINAVKGDPAALLDNLKETSKDPKAVKARSEVERLTEALHQAEESLKAAIAPEFEAARGNAEGEVEKLRAEVTSADGIINAAVNYFKKMYPQLADHLPKRERLSGGAGSGSATGRRMRGFSVTATVDGKSTGYDNASGAAKALNVPTADLQAGFFAAIGDKDLKDAPDEVKWAVEVTEGEGNDATTKRIDLTAKRVVEETATEETPAAA